jgi:cell wall-associated NlpC family hydrolase
MLQRMTAGRSRPLILTLVGIMIATALFPGSAHADTDLSIGGVATVAYANGDSVRLRASPNTGGEVIDHVAEGTQVNVLDGPTGGSGTLWYLIRVNGVKGYMAADFLASSSGLLRSTAGSAWAVDAVNVRSGPSTADSIVTTLGYGDGVTLTGSSSNGWLSVSVGGASGWVYGAFLSQENNSSSSASSSSGSWSGVSGTYYTADNLNLRSGPTTRTGVIATLSRGSQVWLYGEEDNGFALASTEMGDGWLNTAYLTGTQPASNGNASSGASGTRYTSDSLNLRANATTRSAIIETLSRGAEVWVYGREENGFTYASTSAGDGWLNTAYLTSSRPNSSSQAVSTAAVATSDGQRMVDYAMQFLGLPYIWAGAGPGGFDCSGLTMYVAANVLGIDITHSTVLQFGYGSSVAYGDWAPGDLVFFANTYAAGISHVGIYIGDGQFIHAENSGTGVVISSLYDSYYASHYAGARRLA